MYVWSHVCKQNEDTKMFGMWELSEKMTPALITKRFETNYVNWYCPFALCSIQLFFVIYLDHSVEFLISMNTWDNKS